MKVSVLFFERTCFSLFFLAWEQRKVTDVGKIFIGLVTTMTKNYTDVGTLLIRNSDIKDNHFEFDSNPIHLDEGFAKLNDSRRMHIGDVVTVHTGDVGTSAVITEKEDGSIGFATIVTRPNKEIIDSNYLSTYLNTEQHKNWAINQSTGDGRTNYNLKEFTQLIVPLPSLKEQQCISKYIKQIDNLITLHQRKCDKLVNIKKSLLEKMFPKNGNNVPEIRFKGFTEAWEQRKFSDVGCVSMCKRIFKTQTTDIGEVPFFKIGTFGKTADSYITKKLFNEYKAKFSYPEKGDILISASGSIGRIVEFSGKDEYFQDSNIVWLKHNKEISNEFLKQLYQIVKWYGIEGTTIQRLYNSNILNTEFKMPSIDEQNKISSLLNCIDNLITLHQKKLNKLKNIKKSLLDKMFV